MNEIEKAVAYLEDAAHETDEIMADCSPALQAELTEQKEHFVVALAALREQAGRQSGCEYCKDSEDLAYGHDSMQRTGRIYLNGNLLTADLYSESMAAAICFCPVCGKRLEEHHEAD